MTRCKKKYIHIFSVVAFVTPFEQQCEEKKKKRKGIIELLTRNLSLSFYFSFLSDGEAFLSTHLSHCRVAVTPHDTMFLRVRFKVNKTSRQQEASYVSSRLS